MVVKNFKFMENYNSWKMYLQVKILTLDIFTHMLPPPPSPTPIPHTTLPPQPPFPIPPGILKFGIKHLVNHLTLNC